MILSSSRSLVFSGAIRKRDQEFAGAADSLLGADMRIAYDLVPLRDLGLDARAKFRRFVGDRLEAEFAETFLYGWVGHHLDDFGIPSIDDVRRRADRSDDAGQRVAFKIGDPSLCHR